MRYSLQTSLFSLFNNNTCCLSDFFVHFNIITAYIYMFVMFVNNVCIRLTPHFIRSFFLAIPSIIDFFANHPISPIHRAHQSSIHLSHPRHHLLHLLYRLYFLCRPMCSCTSTCALHRADRASK